MKRFIPYLIAAFLCIAFSISITHKALAISDQGQVELTSSRDDEADSYVSGITSGRTKSLVGDVVGLASLIIGWLAKRRSVVKATTARSLAIAGLVLGLIAVILSVAHLASNTGDFGTGGGKAGAIVAMGLGALGMIVSGLALVKTRPRN